ncbi:hypothetical protein [Streptomyces gardneri]|uniref:hypothetical protein n=1 Tax=Streptomyces gardneri TaxID=66892 RepID=UPI0033D737BF
MRSVWRDGLPATRRRLVPHVIENIGSTVARNVRITADPPIESSFGEESTAELQTALARVLPMIPPGRRRELIFDGPGRFGSALPMTYTFTVRCEGPFGPMEDLEHVVDINTLAESAIGQRPLKTIEQSLGKIRDELKGLAAAYEKSNAPAIREEKERVMQAYRERQAERAARADADAQNADGETATTDPSTPA